MRLSKNVKCTAPCTGNNAGHWTANGYYKANKHRDGSWSIKTDKNTVEQIPATEFAEHFVEI